MRSVPETSSRVVMLPSRVQDHDHSSSIPRTLVSAHRGMILMMILS